jgi:hypothetical protein
MGRRVGAWLVAAAVTAALVVGGVVVAGRDRAPAVLPPLDLNGAQTTAEAAEAAAEPAAAGATPGNGAAAATPPPSGAPGPTTPPAGAAAPGANGGPERGAPDVLDLGEASRDAVVKRVVPIVGGLLLALVLLRVVRMR